MGRYRLTTIPGTWGEQVVEGCFVCGRDNRVAPVWPTIFLLAPAAEEDSETGEPAEVNLVCRRCVGLCGDRLSACTDTELAAIRAERRVQDAPSEGEPEEAGRLLASLLGGTATQAEGWIRSVRDNGVVAPRINWLLLGQRAGTKAERSPGPEHLAWVRVAVAAYTHAPEAHGEPFSEEAELQAMRLRAVAIRRLGPRPGDAILDPACVEQWFQERLDMPLDEAQAWAARWTTWEAELQRAAPAERKQTIQRDMEAWLRMFRLKKRLLVLDELVARLGWHCPRSLRRGWPSRARCRSHGDLSAPSSARVQARGSAETRAGPRTRVGPVT
jgi:hypothetical protein